MDEKARPFLRRRSSTTTIILVLVLAGVRGATAAALGAVLDEHEASCEVRPASDVTLSSAPSAAYRSPLDPPLPLSPALGARRVAVVLISLADADVRWTAEQARSIVFTGPRSARAYFEEVSQGRATLQGVLDPEGGDVFGPYVLPVPVADAGCFVDDLTDDALERAAADGLVADDYDTIGFVHAFMPGCASGTATFPPKRGKVWFNGILFTGLVVHEIGHNLGLDHAGAVSLCGARPRTPCVEDGYGDLFDPMGLSNERRFSAWRLYQLGWLSPDEVQVVHHGGVYELQPSALVGGRAPRLILVRSRLFESRFGSFAQWYALETRVATGPFDTFRPGDPVVRGVSIRRVGAGGYSELLDPTPETGVADAPLLPGRTLHDRAYKVRFRTLSVVDGVARVRIKADCRR